MQPRLVEIRRAERQPVSGAKLANRLGVGLRTVERDLARLRASACRLRQCRVHGGSRLPRNAQPQTVSLTFEEIAAVIAGLAALGPTAGQSASSAMRVLLQVDSTLTGSLARTTQVLRKRDLLQAHFIRGNWVGRAATASHRLLGDGPPQRWPRPG
ncbi:HTH domain-containing protein [Pseudarthrobacter sp. S9]|uniref:HTH domain-containing protein n=1 Tax=Pseudarthrobacter sp. S9 TaxID=3418421 RepID=UPI003D02A3E1